ncbi:hypothetical protein [Novosphingobium sp. 9U]|uniref:hypothetical protein n=1 Tax=Novosphingobium sp. 9U TaxID=2653158 RepID=UPI0012F1255E|nr:hypothetical protein [Novosphingobium sp. 9U]VWX53171.1 conserved hypothetical protein [Novosphingobium sp. 9U]
MQDTQVPAPSRAPDTADENAWRAVFLAHLAASSNVAASAHEAKVSPTKVYDARRRDPGFYRAWQEALCEGYEHLEMALVQRLRDGEIKPASGAKRGTRVFDNATALRLLVAHRDSVVRQQALRDVEDTGAILERINLRLDRLRTARLPAPETKDGTDG